MSIKPQLSRFTMHRIEQLHRLRHLCKPYVPIDFQVRMQDIRLQYQQLLPDLEIELIMIHNFRNHAFLSTKLHIIAYIDHLNPCIPKNPFIRRIVVLITQYAHIIFFLTEAQYIIFYQRFRTTSCILSPQIPQKERINSLFSAKEFSYLKLELNC